MPTYKCPMDKLDLPCLIRVLQQVSPQKQLVACGAVCSKWRKATREAISSITVLNCTQKKCDQLQQWLVYPPAALYSLSLCLSTCELHPGLRLQPSVLQHLRDLELYSVHLEALAVDGSVLELADLLPRLQHCTKLAFVACGQDNLFSAAIAAFKDMPALQDLDLECHGLLWGVNLGPLPTTLTRLCLTRAPGINRTSAAGFSQLTGLRVLEVSAFGCDTSVLANFSALERVVLNIGEEAEYMFSGEEGFNTPLLVFANMPSLQHLELQSNCEEYPVATAAEVAALSASSNLTYLSLGDSEYCLLPPAAYDTWFPVAHQCPYLQHVDVGVGVLGNTAAVQRMVSACPGLKELELQSPIEEEIQEVESAQCVAASLQALTNLTGLACLRVDSRDLPKGSCISPAVIDAWSHWTNLQQLELTLEKGCNQVGDLLVLSQLRSLQKLVYRFDDGGQGCDQELLSIQGGSSLDVWCQVPAVLWGGAVTRTQQQVESLQQEQQREQAHVTELLEQQATAQKEAAALSEQQAAAEAHAAALTQQQAAAVEKAAALRQQQAKAHAQVVALQHEQAAAQAKVAALEEQQAAEQAKIAALLQKQQQVEAAVLRERLLEQQAAGAVLRDQLQEQQAEMAAMRQQIIWMASKQRQVKHKLHSSRARLHRCRPLWLHCWNGRAEAGSGAEALKGSDFVQHTFRSAARSQ